jgi:hypothetical protein
VVAAWEADVHDSGAEDEATTVVDQWSELGDASFVVDDLSVRHTPDDILAPEPPDPTDPTDPTDEDYPMAHTTLAAEGME